MVAEFKIHYRQILGPEGEVVAPMPQFAKDAAEVLAKAEKRHADEEGKRKQLAEGKLGLDMYNMREPLAKAGLVYVDGPEDD